MNRALTITASRIALNVHRTEQYAPIINWAGYGNGDACAVIGEARELRSHMSVWLGPLAALFAMILKLFYGTESDRGDVFHMEDYARIDSELTRISEHALYWQQATQRMIQRAEKVRSEGSRFIAPDWFIWLSRFDVSIAPSRLRAIMAALSVKGRAFVMALLYANTSSILRDDACASPQDEALYCAAPLWPD